MFTFLFLNILNKEASSADSKPDEIIASLGIGEGDVIADIGSGGGYFTIAFAGKVGKAGRVYAVDVKPKYLEFIRRKAAREGLDNVSCVLGTSSGWICRKPVSTLCSHGMCFIIFRIRRAISAQ